MTRTVRYLIESLAPSCPRRSPESQARAGPGRGRSESPPRPGPLDRPRVSGLGAPPTCRRLGRVSGSCPPCASADDGRVHAVTSSRNPTVRSTSAMFNGFVTYALAPAQANRARSRGRVIGEDEDGHRCRGHVGVERRQELLGVDVGQVCVEHYQARPALHGHLQPIATTIGDYERDGRPPSCDASEHDPGFRLAADIEDRAAPNPLGRVVGPCRRLFGGAIPGRLEEPKPESAVCPHAPHGSHGIDGR